VARIFWDANLFIYLFEDKGPLTGRVEEIRRGMMERRDTLYTSSLAAGEVLAGPLQAGREDVWEAYLRFFRGPAVHLIPFDLAAAAVYSRIRQDRSISRADAMHLACAGAAQIDLFITNDDRLTRKRVAGVKFVTSVAAAPY
jgi:predicted nucleic acid-binding protein